MENYIQIVQELNAELYEKFGETEMGFGYMTSGFYDMITFGEFIIWDGENDDREFNEETGKYEPFLPFIKNVFNEWVNKLNSLKF